MGCNIWVHESNSRNISVQLSLTSKGALSFLLYTCLFFNKSVIRAEQDLPGTERGEGEGWGRGQSGEMIQTMYAQVNK
jgi:hypothetical protein